MYYLVFDVVLFVVFRYYSRVTFQHTGMELIDQLKTVMTGMFSWLWTAQLKYFWVVGKLAGEAKAARTLSWIQVWLVWSKRQILLCRWPTGTFWLGCYGPTYFASPSYDIPTWQQHFFILCLINEYSLSQTVTNTTIKLQKVTDTELKLVAISDVVYRSGSWRVLVSHSSVFVYMHAFGYYRYIYLDMLEQRKSLWNY